MKTSAPASPVLRLLSGGALILALSAPAGRALRAADKPAPNTAPSRLAQDLVGTWVHLGEPGKAGAPPAKGGFIKFRTARHWVAIVVDPRTGLVESTHGGTWQVVDGKYQETTEYGGEYHAFIMGKTYNWTVKLEGGTMTKTGVDNSWHEVWQRMK